MRIILRTLPYWNGMLGINTQPGHIGSVAPKAFPFPPSALSPIPPPALPYLVSGARIRLGVLLVHILKYGHRYPFGQGGATGNATRSDLVW